VAEIRERRERAFIKKRIHSKKHLEKAANLRELKQNIDIIAPAAVRLRQKVCPKPETLTRNSKSWSARSLKIETRKPGPPSTRNPNIDIIAPAAVRLRQKVRPKPHRGTSLKRERSPLGPYRRPVPRVLGG